MGGQLHPRHWQGKSTSTASPVICDRGRANSTSTHVSYAAECGGEFTAFGLRLGAALPLTLPSEYPTATQQEWTRWPSPSPSLSLGRDPESPQPSARRHWRCTSIAEPNAWSSGKVTASHSIRAALPTYDTCGASDGNRRARRPTLIHIKACLAQCHRVARESIHPPHRPDQGRLSDSQIFGGRLATVWRPHATTHSAR